MSPHAFSIIGAALSLGFVLTIAENDAGSRAAAATACPSLISKTAIATGFISTVSESYVNIGGTKVKFVQGGTKPGCVMVSFAGQAFSSASENMVIQVLLDDTTPCAPADIVFVASAASPPAAASRAMDFLCSDVAPGGHSVRMQYKAEGGTTVAFYGRVMTVRYVP
jgi:hypothetical protein